MAYPAEHDVNRQILVSRGVAAGSVRLYGSDLASTVEEAEAFARAWRPRGRSVLVVTSRVHARRSRLVFRKALPGVRVRVAATPYETFSRAWWRHKELALSAVHEAFKALYYLSGAGFVKNP